MKRKKRAEISRRALYFRAPHIEKCTLRSPCKKQVYSLSSANSNSQGLAQAWATSGPPPPPAHPWFSKRRTRDGRNGRTGTKFCRSLITQIVLSLRPCPPFSFPFQLSLWYIQQNITLKKLFFRNQAGERRKTAMRCRNGSLAPVWFYITNTQQLI
jgi:hypothetical protein